jgi:hypothetical protein
MHTLATSPRIRTCARPGTSSVIPWFLLRARSRGLHQQIARRRLPAKGPYSCVTSQIFAFSCKWTECLSQIFALFHVPEICFALQNWVHEYDARPRVLDVLTCYVGVKIRGHGLVYIDEWLIARACAPLYAHSCTKWPGSERPIEARHAARHWYQHVQRKFLLRTDKIILSWTR